MALPGREPAEDVRKTAVLRAGGLGDFVFTLPALEALRAAYPGAEIVLLGGPVQAALVEGRPGPADRAVLVPPSTGVNGPDTGVDEDDEEELAEFFARMRAQSASTSRSRCTAAGATPTRSCANSGRASRRARAPRTPRRSTTSCPTSSPSRST